MEALPPLGVVRPAHKVVKGHVEVVREGDEILISWFARAILIPLIGHWSHIDGVCHLLLCKITHGWYSEGKVIISGFLEF